MIPCDMEELGGKYKSTANKDHVKYEDPALLPEGALLLVSLNILRRK